MLCGAFQAVSYTEQNRIMSRGRSGFLLFLLHLEQSVAVGTGKTMRGAFVREKDRKFFVSFSKKAHLSLENFCVSGYTGTNTIHKRMI